MTRALRITVGVDSESASELAVDWAIREAQRQPSEITLLTAVDLLMSDPLDDEELLERERDRVRAAVPAVVVNTAVAEGSIPEVLKHYARRSDLLVIGSHRTRHWQSVLSGNLPLGMARALNCPIVIVPDDWTPRQGSVTVGLDDDASSDAALRRAGEFARVGGGDLRVVHAWVRPPEPSDPVSLYLGDRSDPQGAHRQRLEWARRRLVRRQPGLTIHEHLYEGAAFAGLLHLSEQAELIVIGSHRRGPLAGLILGSVARQLLHFSKIPVCVVPPKREVAHARLGHESRLGAAT
jgi:nucleotide-binding universal stress UspA family protein